MPTACTAPNVDARPWLRRALQLKPDYAWAAGGAVRPGARGGRPGRGALGSGDAQDPFPLSRHPGAARSSCTRAAATSTRRCAATASCCASPGRSATPSGVAASALVAAGWRYDLLETLDIAVRDPATHPAAGTVWVNFSLEILGSGFMPPREALENGALGPRRRRGLSRGPGEDAQQTAPAPLPAPDARLAGRGHRDLGHGRLRAAGGGVDRPRAPLAGRLARSRRGQALDAAQRGLRPARSGRGCRRGRGQPAGAGASRRPCPRLPRAVAGRRCGARRMARGGHPAARPRAGGRVRHLLPVPDAAGAGGRAARRAHARAAAADRYREALALVRRAVALQKNLGRYPALRRMLGRTLWRAALTRARRPALAAPLFLWLWIERTC